MEKEIETWHQLRTLNTDKLMRLKIKRGKMGTIKFRASSGNTGSFHVISDEQYQIYKDKHLENKRLKNQIEIVKKALETFIDKRDEIK